VIAIGDAPVPAWDIARLTPSPYDETGWSAGVRMSLTKAVLDQNKTELDFTIKADRNYSYGEVYTVEVLLNGTWYGIPYASGAFNSLGYSIGLGEEKSHTCTPVFAYGILPPGQYRLIKEFDLSGPESPEGMPTTLAKEFAAVEFTVTETLDWEDIR